MGQLGTDAQAGVALVFPALMLMQMMSAGAMGGGISSAIARAIGARRQADANALVVHALIISGALGLTFSIIMLTAGRALYTLMGGHDATLEAALTYSNVLFAGIVLLWIFNALASVLRGTGNMALPAIVTTVGALLVIPLSPLLILVGGRFRAGVSQGVLRPCCFTTRERSRFWRARSGPEIMWCARRGTRRAYAAISCMKSCAWVWSPLRSR